MKAVEQLLRATGQSFEHPRQDWRPFVIGFTPTGYELHEIDSYFMSSPQAKDRFYLGVLPSLIRFWKAERVAVAFSSWLRWVPIPDSPEGKNVARAEIQLMNEIGLRNFPDKIEAVFVTLMDKQREAQAYARILRDDENPPELSDFEYFKERTPLMSGRVAQGLRSALR